MRFEERHELKPYTEPVTASLLREGDFHFSVQFADKQMPHSTSLETWVFSQVESSVPTAKKDRLYFLGCGILP